MNTLDPKPHRVALADMNGTNIGWLTAATACVVMGACGGESDVGGAQTNGVGSTNSVGTGGAAGQGGAAVGGSTAMSTSGNGGAGTGGGGTGGGGTGGGASAPGATRLSLGYAHTCALTSTNGAKCWGANYTGALGNDTATDSSTPVDVVGLGSGVTAIAANGQFSCALTTTGSVKCWGLNQSGQLGDGSGLDRMTPVDVVGLPAGISQLVTGWAHTCVVTTVGAVKCWGQNYDGELGNGNPGTNQLQPVDVVGLSSGVVQLSARGSFTCAVTTSGGVKCWGAGNVGQIGDGANVDRSLPTDVTGLSSGVVAIATGSSHACALMSGGGLRCWGHNTYGQLGNGQMTNSSIPVDAVGAPAGITRLHVGGHYTCVVTSNGAAKCWGYNSDGQLGNGNNNDSATPVDVTGLSGPLVQFAPGSRHTCALLTGNNVQCWGWNQDGELGDGSNTPSLSPVDVIGF